MTLLDLFPQKRYLPRNSVLYSTDSSAGELFFLLFILFLAQKPFAANFGSTLFPIPLSPRFSLRFYVLIMQNVEKHFI